jgi:sugar lactone lactonase YvrE
LSRIDDGVPDPPLNVDYTIANSWRKTPAELEYEFVTDLAVGPDDRVYVLSRQPGFVLVYEPDGSFVRSFGSEQLGIDPHGITIANERIFVSDQFNHVVLIFTMDGRLLGSIGTHGKPSDTGVDDTLTDVFVRAASIRRGGPPFNRPTAVAVAKNGDLYVADGYNNSRVHRFSPDGKLIHSWGEPGPLPGQFWIVHHIAITADDRILVVDRGNERVQVFSLDGGFVGQWTGFQHPSAVVPLSDGNVMVGELSWKVEAGCFTRGRITEPMDARVSIVSPDGRLLRRSVTNHGETPFKIRSPHGMDVDSRGNLYVADLRVARKEEPQHQMVKKFVKRRAG